MSTTGILGIIIPRQSCFETKVLGPFGSSWIHVWIQLDPTAQAPFGSNCTPTTSCEKSQPHARFTYVLYALQRVNDRDPHPKPTPWCVVQIASRGFAGTFVWRSSRTQNPGSIHDPCMDVWMDLVMIAYCERRLSCGQRYQVSALWLWIALPGVAACTVEDENILQCSVPTTNKVSVQSICNNPTHSGASTIGSLSSAARLCLHDEYDEQQLEHCKLLALSMPSLSRRPRYRDQRSAG